MRSASAFDLFLLASFSATMPNSRKYENWLKIKRHRDREYGGTSAVLPVRGRGERYFRCRGCGHAAAFRA